MTDLVNWLYQAQFNYDELDDERLGLISESEVTRKCKEAAAEIKLLRGLLQWWLDAGPDAAWDEYERCVREALEKK